MNHWVRRSKQEAIGPNFSLFGVAPKHCLVFTPTKALLLNSQLPSMSLKLITLSRCRCRNATKLSRARIGFLVSCLETLLWYNVVKSSICGATIFVGALEVPEPTPAQLGLLRFQTHKYVILNPEKVRCIYKPFLYLKKAFVSIFVLYIDYRVISYQM